MSTKCFFFLKHRVKESGCNPGAEVFPFPQPPKQSKNTLSYFREQQKNTCLLLTTQPLVQLTDWIHVLSALKSFHKVITFFSNRCNRGVLHETPWKSGGWCWKAVMYGCSCLVDSGWFSDSCLCCTELSRHGECNSSFGLAAADHVWARY